MKLVSGKTWRNWSGSVISQPDQILYPSSMEEVTEAVRQAGAQGKKLRVVGSGHSFTPLVRTDEVLLSLDQLQGIQHIDQERQIAHLWAGIKLKTLGESLHDMGWAQENLGDINHQSIAGAVSTGTHGTGIHFGSIATQVAGITAVTADGSIIECGEDENPELFKAMQVSLGALGVITQVKLRVVPTWRAHYESKRISIKECMDQLETLRTTHRHFEFYIFPYSDLVQVKFMNQTDKPASKNSMWNTFNKIVMENWAFWLLSEGCRMFPRLTRPVSRLSSKVVPVFSEVGNSYNLFATPRLVRFNEMEYNIPVEHMEAVLEEVQACIDKHQFPVHFPIECRYVKGDDIWLSPAYGRDSAYIAVHMYKGMPYKAYFTALENIFLKYGGRPHWGKMHMLEAKQLAERYPKWQDFMQLRQKLDPNGLFLNDYLQRIFIH